MAQAERRLAAIMFTDVAGYTSLSQRNEALALQLLEEHRRLLRPFFPKHAGKEIKTIGDAFLVEFASALEAVRCAFEMQQSLHERNALSPPERKVLLRIGIHLGDVIHNQNDVYGDAVNVASRIESLADRGGICLTEQVYDHVKNKFEFPIMSIGRQFVKNVDAPLDVYKVVLPWEEKVNVGAEHFDRRRVAVLPFSNISPDPTDEYFADGMTEELISTISKIPELTVISRTSVMKYKGGRMSIAEIRPELKVGAVLEGSVRKAGAKVRISVQLIDANNEGHLWAENYDKQLDDIFAVQSEIAEKVAEKLKVRLLESERKTLKESPTKDVEAYTLYLKGRYHWNIRSKEEIKKAIEYFELAVEQDPRFALGYSGLADCYHVMAGNGQAEPRIAYPMAKEYVAKALELDEKLAEAHAALGGIFLYHDYDYDKAETEFRRAIELKPSYSAAHQWYSHLLAAEGRFSEALEQIKKAVELDPISRVINVNLGLAFYLLKEYDKAIEQLKKVVALDSRFAAVWKYLVWPYVRISAFDEALKAADRYGELAGQPLAAKLERAYVYAAMGRADDCKTLLDEVKRRFSEEILSPYIVASVYFLLRYTDEGFQWLEKAYEERDPWLVWMGVDEDLQGVRSDRRYASLLERIGLSKNLTRT